MLILSKLQNIMQGKKEYYEKLFVEFSLENRIPQHNFYRKLKDVLDLHFLYAQTEPYYGVCGQKSIDPVVFFKLCLVGYLENIISDRKLMEHCSMRIDILYFLDYDIDETLPWHSTISRTRQLFPDDVFTAVFNHLFSMCVEKGMVSGHTQVVDSAPVKANASMDSLELKVPEEELEEHIRKVRVYGNKDRIVKNNKASQEQKIITASKRDLQGVASRNKKWKHDDSERPGAKHNQSKYTSNKTHYSPSDPDARISVKPGKARKLNYAGQMSVDSAHHVISDIYADYADNKDNQSLPQVTEHLQKRLKENGLLFTTLLADAGYSSGENYAMLEQKGIQSYIPPHGTYKGGPEGFTFDEERNGWVCSEGKLISFRRTRLSAKGLPEHHYRGTRDTCRDCPRIKQCLGKSAKEKVIRVTVYKPEYDRAIARVQSKRGRRMKRKRHSTVEPVFGTLTQFMGMRKVYTRGINNANKIMLMSAAAYNLKKYLKFERKLVNAGTKSENSVRFSNSNKYEAYILKISFLNFSLN
jgi:transposase